MAIMDPSEKRPMILVFLELAKDVKKKSILESKNRKK